MKNLSIDLHTINSTSLAWDEYNERIGTTTSVAFRLPGTATPLVAWLTSSLAAGTSTTSAFGLRLPLLFDFPGLRLGGLHHHCSTGTTSSRCSLGTTSSLLLGLVSVFFLHRTSSPLIAGLHIVCWCWEIHHRCCWALLVNREDYWTAGACFVTASTV